MTRGDRSGPLTQGNAPSTSPAITSRTGNGNLSRSATMFTTATSGRIAIKRSTPATSSHCTWLDETPMRIVLSIPGEVGARLKFASPSHLGGIAVGSSAHTK